MFPALAARRKLVLLSDWREECRKEACIRNRNRNVLPSLVSFIPVYLGRWNFKKVRRSEQDLHNRNVKISTFSNLCADVLFHYLQRDGCKVFLSS